MKFIRQYMSSNTMWKLILVVLGNFVNQPHQCAPLRYICFKKCLNKLKLILLANYSINARE